jgi:hypothetical protein
MFRGCHEGPGRAGGSGGRGKIGGDGWSDWSASRGDGKLTNEILGTQRLFFERSKK